MHYEIKKNADLDSLLGTKLAASVRTLRKESMKRLPSSVTFTGSKPKFYLDDGSVLHAYSVNLASMTIEASRYCGSADTVCNNVAEQLSEGYQPPENTALLLVETYWNGRNMSWSVTVVSRNLQPALTA